MYITDGEEVLSGRIETAEVQYKKSFVQLLVLIQRTGRTLINGLSRGGIVQAESPFRHVLHQSLLACSRLVSAVAVGHCIFSQVESPAVFRFSGRVKTPKWGEAHQVDERMPVDKLYMPVDFFKTFLGNYNK